MPNSLCRRGTGGIVVPYEMQTIFQNNYGHSDSTNGTILRNHLICNILHTMTTKGSFG